MARPRDPLDLAQEVGFGLVVVAVVYAAELLDLDAVGCTQVFPDYLLGDVAADILAVVTLLFHFQFLLFRLEYLGVLLLIRIHWAIGEN